MDLSPLNELAEAWRSAALRVSAASEVKLTADKEYTEASNEETDARQRLRMAMHDLIVPADCVHHIF